MKGTLIYELAARFGVKADDLEKEMTEPYPGVIRFPSLVSALGEHSIHYAVDEDPKWLLDIGLHFASKRNSIFKTFKRLSRLLPEDERSSLIVFLQTPIGAFCIYRARGYEGQAASFLHRDATGWGYVVEPFETWFMEQTRIWRSQ